MRVKIDGINDALKFSRIADGFADDVDVTDGRYIVNGKSQMGLIMICAEGKPLEANILTEDTLEYAKFRHSIEEFLVTGE